MKMIIEIADKRGKSKHSTKSLCMHKTKMIFFLSMFYFLDEQNFLSQLCTSFGDLIFESVCKNKNKNFDAVSDVL